MLANRDLFLLHQRNQNAFEQLEDNERHEAENEDMEERFRRFLANPAIPLEQRVRMACSVGAVFAALIGAGGIFGDIPTSRLAELVRQAAHDLLGPNAAG